MRSASDGRRSAIVTLALSGAIALAADGCSRVTVGDGGGGGSGGRGGGGESGSAGGGGDGGTTGIGGTGGGAGTVIGGSGGGGAGGRGGAGAGGSAATGGTGGTGGVAGTLGRGGTGGNGGTTGSAGTGGRGGTGGNGGTTGSAGTGGTSGRGGTGGTGGAGGGVTPSAPGQIVITELMHNSATVADDFGEWFEVYNPSTTVTYDLMGCEVLDSSLTGPPVATPLVLPPMTFKTLAVSATPGGPTGTAFTPDYVYGLDVKFDNNAGERAGISCGGMLIDEFVYPTSVAAGGGRAFNLDPRHYNAADNNDTMLFWCLARNTMVGDAYETTGPNFGTPGRANTECPQVTQ